MTYLRRVLAVPLLGLLPVLMGGACDDPWKAWENQATEGGAPDSCCTPSQPYHFDCLQTVNYPCPGPGACPTQPQCTDKLAQCFASQAEADQFAKAHALIVGGPGSTLVNGTWPPCVRDGCPPKLRRPGGGAWHPLDAPLCGSSSCLSNGDACTDGASCCSGMCSEHDECETCRMTLEGCVMDTECCSGTCSLNACA
jgi:hypothetical protein